MQYHSRFLQRFRNRLRGPPIKWEALTSYHGGGPGAPGRDKDHFWLQSLSRPRTIELQVVPSGKIFTKNKKKSVFLFSETSEFSSAGSTTFSSYLSSSKKIFCLLVLPIFFNQNASVHHLDTFFMTCSSFLWNKAYFYTSSGYVH